MASTGWKEWKKKEMAADDSGEMRTDDEQPPGPAGDVVDAADPADRWAGITDLNAAYRRAVESTTDLVTFHARGGRMLFANRAARELIGVGPDDPLPRVEMHDFFDATDAQLAEMRTSIIQHGRWAGELEVCGLDLRIPASVVVTGHRDADGRYEYFSALSRDITERRATDAARRRSEAALRSIVQSSPLPIFAVDAAGTVHVWNRACEELFGWTAAEVVGSPPPFASGRRVERDDRPRVLGRDGPFPRGPLRAARRRDGRRGRRDRPVAQRGGTRHLGRRRRGRRQ